MAIVNVAVTAPDAPATKLAGVTSAFVITPGVRVLSATVVNVSIAVPPVFVVVIVYVPVVPDIPGFFTLPNTTVVTPPAVKAPGVPAVPLVTVTF